MRRIVIFRLASVAALSLIPLACNDLGTEPEPPRHAPQIPYALTDGLWVDPDVSRLDVGDVLQFEVTVRDRDRVIPDDLPFIWESTDPSVASVDGEGRVEAHAPGRVTITLGYRQYEADVMILVRTPLHDGGNSDG